MMASVYVLGKRDTVASSLPLRFCFSEALAEEDSEKNISTPSETASPRKPRSPCRAPSSPSLPNKAELGLLQVNMDKGIAYRCSSGADHTPERVALECAKVYGIHVPVRKCVPEDKENYQLRTQIGTAQSPNAGVPPNAARTDRTVAQPLHNSKAPLMQTKVEQNSLNRSLDAAMGKENGRNTPIVSKSSDDRVFEAVPTSTPHE